MKVTILVDRSLVIKTLWEFYGSSFEQTWIPFIQVCIVPSLVEISPAVLEKIFNFINVFSLFCNNLSLEKRGVPSFEHAWIPFTQGCIMQRLVEIWRRRFLDFVNLFCLFHYFLLLKKGMAQHESSSTKNAWCQVWLNQAEWFWRKRFFLISLMFFHYFIINSPGKRAGPSFEQTWIPFNKYCFVPSLVEFGPVVLEKKGR